MRCNITAILAATFLALQIPSVLAQDLRFELHQAIEAKDWNHAIEIVDKLIQTSPQEAQELREYRTQLQNHLPKIPASTGQQPRPNLPPAATTKPTNLPITTPVTPSPWQNARLLRTLKAREAVYAAALSRDGKTLISGGKNELEIWNLQTGESKFLLDWVPQKYKYTITAIAISPDGQTFVTGSRGIASKSVRSNPSGCTSSGNSGSFGLNCSLGGTSRNTTFSSGGSAIQVWSQKTGEQLLTLEDGSNANFPSFGGGINFLSFSSDGQTLLSTEQLSKSKLWDTRTGKMLRYFTTTTPKNSLGRSCHQSLAVSPDFQFIATPFGRISNPNGDAGIRLENLNTRKLQSLLAFVASRQNNADQKRYSIIIQSLLDLSGCVTFSPDGEMVAASGGGIIFVWRMSTGEKLYTLSASISEKDFWDSILKNRYDGTLTFSPDNQVLASRSDNGTIKLWDLRNGQLLTTLTGHTDVQEANTFSTSGSVPVTVSFLGFSPDGKTLISAGADGTIKIWGMQ